MSRRTEEMLTANEAAETAEHHKLRVFTAGSLAFALFEDDLATVVSWRRPTPLPHAPVAVLGVVSIQGRMLTVLDPGVLLEATSNGTGTARFIVALRGDEQLALAVDEEGESLNVDSIQPGPANGASVGVVRLKEDSISVLDVKKLFGLAIRGRERRQRRF